MKINSVGIIGYGHFGQHVEELIARFAPQVEVKIFSKRFEEDGQRFFSQKEVCACDAVVLCCSIGDFESELEHLLSDIPDTTVIVDVATVKTHTQNVLQKLAGNRPYISTHPMFGPESYKKTRGDVEGYRVVVTEHTLKENIYNQFKDFITQLGFKVIEMTADEHDRLLADTLFLTHYIGQTMKQAGFLRTDIDTVSFQSLMNAVESVAHDEKLFLDVYSFNPYCKETVEKFKLAEQNIFGKLGEI